MVKKNTKSNKKCSSITSMNDIQEIKEDIKKHSLLERLPQEDKILNSESNVSGLLAKEIYKFNEITGDIRKYKENNNVKKAMVEDNLVENIIKKAKHEMRNFNPENVDINETEKLVNEFKSLNTDYCVYKNHLVSLSNKTS